MRDAVAVPVTVKHRIGLDRNEDYSMVRDFVGALGDAGCEVFIVHARNAWLKGLSPKENREVPPLRYDVVARLKQDFASATFVLNGGITDLAHAGEALERFDGVMLGRAAYHDPYLLTQIDGRFFGEKEPPLSRAQIVLRMTDRLRRHIDCGEPERGLLRHMLGLYQHQQGARRWRRILSDARMIERYGANVLQLAAEAVCDRELIDLVPG